MAIIRDVFIGLSENKILNDLSKQMGLRFGAQNVVGGTGVEDTIIRLKDINDQGMSVTVDNLGEFISERSEATREKENIIKILDKWKNIDKSVIWINCESLDLEIQYTTLKEDNEEKWNIAFYDANEEKIFDDLNHMQVLEDLLFNNGCNTDDLINESDYFVNKMIKIIRELRKEGHITDDTAVILSNLEISENTLNIAKKINKKETIKGFAEEFGM